MNKLSQLNNEIIDSYNDVHQTLDIYLSEYALKREKNYYPNLVPMFYKDFEETTNKILFVGINPSFSLKMYSDIDKDIFSYSLFKEKNIDVKITLIEELIKIQEGLIYGNYNKVKQIQYFKHLDSFSQKIGFQNSWDHFDLFPNRCTNQGIFTKALMQTEFNDYKKKCITRFNKIVNENNFRAVFILNKASSNFSRENLLGLKIFESFKEFKNPTYGLYHLNKTPFILFKQLSFGATSNKELEMFLEKTKTYLKR